MTHRRKKSISGMLLKAIIVLLPICLIFSIVWLRSNLVALEYELGQLQMQKVNLIKEKSELVAIKAKITSAKKIEYAASRKMGLVYPDRKKVFFVKITTAPTPHTARLSVE